MADLIERFSGRIGPLGRRWIRLAVLAPVLAGTVQLLHFRMGWDALWAWLTARPGLFLLSGLMVLAAEAFFFALTGSALKSGIVCGALFLLMGCVDSLLILYRREPFYPRELGMTCNLPSLVRMTSPADWLPLLAGLILLAALLILLRRRLPAPPPFPRRGRLVVLALSSALLAGFVTAGAPGSPMGGLYRMAGAAPPDAFGALSAYDENGFLIAFSSQITAPLMERPPEYGEEAVMEIVARYRDRAAEHNARLPEREQPHVVLVMSEAFSDPTGLSGLSFSRDPIPRIRAMLEEYPSGLALTPGYGGGTAQCEFEALTGFSTALCGGVSPYENGVGGREAFPSLAHVLKARGYTATALHPYHSGMYNRPAAYKAMGFDTFIDMYAMDFIQKPDRSDYISDAAAYAQVLQMLEQSEGPAFVHLVTMQNHGDYAGDRFDNTILAEGLSQKENAFLAAYSQGLAYTDEATAAFFDELDKLSRETLVLFWGDHLPVGYSEGFADGFGQAMYETPFFIRGGEAVAGTDYGTHSPLFFGTLLMKAAGMECTPFAMQLEDLQEYFHGIHLRYTLDAQGDDIGLEALAPEARTRLEELRLIQYDVLLGEGYSLAAGYF